MVQQAGAQCVGAINAGEDKADFSLPDTFNLWKQWKPPTLSQQRPAGVWTFPLFMCRSCSHLDTLFGGNSHI